MALPRRQSVPTIETTLLTEPYRFEFHQAVKLLEYLHPDAVPFGETVNPDEEVVTIKSRVFLETLSSDIYSLEQPSTYQTTPTILTVNFMGIAGIQGPLPLPYTEMMIQRIRNGDTSLNDFLDIFNHRLIAILHRIRKQYMISLNTLSPEKTDIAVGLKAFLGLGAPSLQNRLPLPDRSLLDYAGIYWCHPHSAAGLIRVLEGYFKMPVEIERCVGRWRPITGDQVTRIGKSGQWQGLGQGAALGKRAWDQENKFTLCFSPVSAEELDAFLPNGKKFPQLQGITQLYGGAHQDFSVRYKVISPPSTFLGRKSYLGWRAWLGKSLLSGDDVRIEASRLITLND